MWSSHWFWKKIVPQSDAFKGARCGTNLALTSPCAKFLAITHAVSTPAWNSPMQRHCKRCFH